MGNVQRFHVAAPFGFGTLSGMRVGRSIGIQPTCGLGPEKLKVLTFDLKGNMSHRVPEHEWFYALFSRRLCRCFTVCSLHFCIES